MASLCGWESTILMSILSLSLTPMWKGNDYLYFITIMRKPRLTSRLSFYTLIRALVV